MIPAKPDQVTAKWLSEILGHPVTSVDIEPIGVGVGLLGELLRVTPTYKTPNEDVPTSVIVKRPTHAEHNKAIGMAFRFYERELRVYAEVAPTARVRVPSVHHSDMDIETEQFVLVLEDLSNLELADQVLGMTPEQAIQAVQAIAPFHAQWWESPALEKLHWLPAADDPITMQAAKVYEDGWLHFVEKWGHVVPAGGLELGERVRDAYRAMLTELAVPPRTFVHTDFRLDNLFFGDNGVTVIDWQLSTRSSGVYDVAYLLSQSMDVELRRENQAAILGAWHERLCQAGVSGYSLDQANDDYAASVLVCLVVAVAAGADMELGNERGEALVRALAERGFSAALDVDWERVLRRVGA
jgi:aminoglycoside/choline kinase family phosphotransferase